MRIFIEVWWNFYDSDELHIFYGIHFCDRKILTLSLFLKKILQYFTDYLEKVKDMINLTITQNAVSFNILKLHKFLFA